MRTYYIALKDGRTGGLDVEGNVIVAVPPIWNGWRGGSFAQFCSYYKPVNMYEITHVAGGLYEKVEAPNAKETPQQESDPQAQGQTKVLK